MAWMAILCKQQTLAANQLIDTVCCLHAVAVRPQPMSAFSNLRSDGTAVWLYMHQTVECYYVSSVSPIWAPGR